MAKATRSQEWRKKMTNLVLESEKRQEARLKSRLQDMINELKGLLIGNPRPEIRAEGFGTLSQQS